MDRAVLGLLLCGALFGQARYARLGEWEGAAEVKIHPADAWTTALRNSPLIQGAHLAAGAASRLEAELDEGSVLRLAADSSCELADYARLSTGQRITHIAVDRGVAYFSGEPESRDALVLSAPGLQGALKRGSRVRVETENGVSQLAVIEGEVHVYTPWIEIDIREGKTFRLDSSRPDKFSLRDEVAPLDSDTWSRERDQLLPLGFGRRDVDLNGDWIATAELGTVWKPKAPPGWAPFREGKWVWYDGLGYTWIGAESWGWLPYHSGRWLLQPSLGWIWIPDSTAVFQPGAVYWMRGANFAAWGPLAPGENWTAAGAPQLYAAAHTTFAAFTPGAREIDPAGFAAKPKDPLTAAAFTASLPSPAPLRERLEWVRQPARPGVIRLSPALAPPPAIETARPRREPERAKTPAPPPRQEPPQVVAAGAGAGTAVANPITESVYFVPVYTGIIVINPPERKPPAPKERADRSDPSVPREGENRRRSR
ncbi:MAG: FecR domain-containing protein [Acidobacteria bacterium]|nr:FecR domain-containing protein [Acidobacteriota bacterium]